MFCSILLCVRVGDCCSWERFFKSIFSKFPYKTERKKENPRKYLSGLKFLDFAFCCKSEIRISKSQSRFTQSVMFYFWLMSRKNTWLLPHLTPCSHLGLNKNGAKETVEANGFVAPRGFVHLQLFLWKQDSAFTGSSLCLFSFDKAGEGGGGYT